MLKCITIYGQLLAMFFELSYKSGQLAEEVTRPPNPIQFDEISTIFQKLSQDDL